MSKSLKTFVQVWDLGYVTVIPCSGRLETWQIKMYLSSLFQLLQLGIICQSWEGRKAREKPSFYMHDCWSHGAEKQLIGMGNDLALLDRSPIPIWYSCGLLMNTGLVLFWNTTKFLLRLLLTWFYQFFRSMVKGYKEP